MDIRKKFLDYFKERDHLIIPSASLIPENDLSVLITTAGMQQFKPYYLGTKKPPKNKISTLQKCFRTSDIDNVGYSEQHLTFFEMLGNFSFGDYFKKESINFAIDFILDILKIQKEKICIGVFAGDKEIPEDKESIEFWKENGIELEKIYKFGREENFWGPAGDTGPCGPCTEIYYDFGEEYGCGRDDCNPDCRCERFLEIWNLVFTQYNFNGKKYIELPSKNIDTGLGVERIYSVMENTPSVFKTSLFKEILKKIEEISGKKLTLKNEKGFNPEINKSIKVVADHGRAIYFLTSDGVVPSNEGRGYILRRIIRRAIRFGKLIGMSDYFLNDIGKVVIDKYKNIYPELLNKKELSFDIVRNEEKRFSKTLKDGTEILNQSIRSIKNNDKKYLDSKDAFKLYDTFGFPVELTMEILMENNLRLNLNEFNSLMKRHSEKSRNKASFDKKIDSKLSLYKKINKKVCVEFKGYQEFNVKTEIMNIVRLDENKQPEIASRLSEGEEGEVILRITPFYGEKGGQSGDKGIISSNEGIFVVEDCNIPLEGIYTHKGRVKKGKIEVGMDVNAKIDIVRRKNINKNHTATHILHWALRNFLGKDVKQSGSFVDEDRFRFDYSSNKNLGTTNLRKIENIINEKIQINDSVRCFETTKEYADEIGAVALFGEKYGKFVRVVEIDNYSRELCAGTHVKRTGEIGLLKIISDVSIGANNRRIEAVTGMFAYNYLAKKERIVKNILSSLDVEEEKIVDKLNEMKNDMKKIEEEINIIQRNAAKKEILVKFPDIKKDSEIKVIDYNFSGTGSSLHLDIKSMGTLGDEIINLANKKNIFVVFGNVINNKPVIILQTSKDLTGKGIDCSKLAKKVGKILKGGGGGKLDFAQVGGADIKSLEKAISFAKNVVKDLIKNNI